MNKYCKWYNQIVEHWKIKNLKYRTKGTVRHHIKPKATFDANTSKSIINAPDNLVVVPHRVHFVLHRLYAKFDTTGTQEYALLMMANGYGKEYMNITSRTYAVLAVKQAERMRKLHTDPNFMRINSDSGYKAMLKLRLNQSVQKKRKDAARYALLDKAIYRFKNIETGKEEICRQYDLRMKYNLHCGALGSIIRGKRKIHKNWVFLGVYNET